MIVAMLALISGLAGTAVALQGKNSVKAKDIAPKAVKGPAIAPKAVKSSKLANGAVKGSKIGRGAVSAPNLDVFRTGVAPTEVTTTSSPPTDLGGPGVKVNVGPNGLINIYARVEGRAVGGGDNGAAHVHLFEPTLLPDAPRIMEVARGGGFQTRLTAPGTGDVDGAPRSTRAGMITLSAPPGTYTFQLRYSQAGGATASFRNRTLWAGVFN